MQDASRANKMSYRHAAAPVWVLGPIEGARLEGGGHTPATRVVFRHVGPRDKADNRLGEP